MRNRVAEGDRAVHQPVGAVPEVDPLDAVQALDKDGGSDQQQHRQRGLRHNKRRAQGRAPPAALARANFHVADDVEVACPNRRQHTGRGAAAHRERDGDGENPRVEERSVDRHTGQQ